MYEAERAGQAARRHDSEGGKGNQWAEFDSHAFTVFGVSHDIMFY